MCCVLELYFLFSLHLWLSFKGMLVATFKFDYIGCDFGLHFLARLTKAKFTCNIIFIPSTHCTMRFANLWTYQSRLS